MKHFLFILFILVNFISIKVKCQTVTNGPKGYGLVDTSGQQLLPNMYTHIRPMIIRMNKTSYFIYKYYDKFGIFNSINKEDTGARFDSIEVLEQGYVILYAKQLKGFLAENKPLEFTLIEPQFQSIVLNKKPYGADLYYPSDYPWDHQKRNLIVKFNGLWGVMNYNTGNWVIQPKYKQQLSYDNDNHLYQIKSTNSYETWLINPENGTEFYFPYEMKYSVIDGELHIASKYQKPGIVAIYRLNSGQEIFKYVSEHRELKFNYIDAKILQINEEIYHEDQKDKITHNTLWFSLTSGREILYVALKESEQIKVVTNGDKNHVYIWEEYGRKRKIIGEMQGTFVLWKDKKYERH